VLNLTAIDLTHFKSSHSLRNKVERVVWGIVWTFFYRPSPRPLHAWRRGLLRLFGARIGKGARPHPRVRIWLPRKLEMGEYSILGDDVDCYCVDRITIGAHAVVSQYTYLCTATHDYKDPTFPLVTAPINIGDRCWVAADVFIGPGITIGERSVIGARSSVFDSIPSDVVAFGNPARVQIKRRRNV